MHSVTGIFSTWADAARATAALRGRQFRPDEINMLAPGADPGSVATAAAEQPGLGAAIGGVTGGAAGAAVGVQLLAAAATGLVPGVGPVLAVGAIAGILAGIAGAAAGHAIENTLTEGLPKDELYVYADALRRGRTVIIVLAPDSGRADEARATLQEAGAESLDAARETWWVGLRDAEARAYSADDPTLFAKDEADFRRGFEMAVRLGGPPWEEAVVRCGRVHPDACDRASYRRGFERGREYCRASGRA